jgi:hypothetical protein
MPELYGINMVFYVAFRRFQTWELSPIGKARVPA